MWKRYYQDRIKRWVNYNVMYNTFQICSILLLMVIIPTKLLIKIAITHTIVTFGYIIFYLYRVHRYRNKDIWEEVHPPQEPTSYNYISMWHSYIQTRGFNIVYQYYTVRDSIGFGSKNTPTTKDTLSLALALIKRGFLLLWLRQILGIPLIYPRALYFIWTHLHENTYRRLKKDMEAIFLGIGGKQLIIIGNQVYPNGMTKVILYSMYLGKDLDLKVLTDKIPMVRAYLTRLSVGDNPRIQTTAIPMHDEKIPDHPGFKAQFLLPRIDPNMYFMSSHYPLYPALPPIEELTLKRGFVGQIPQDKEALISGGGYKPGTNMLIRNGILRQNTNLDLSYLSMGKFYHDIKETLYLIEHSTEQPNPVWDKYINTYLPHQKLEPNTDIMEVYDHHMLKIIENLDLDPNDHITNKVLLSSSILANKHSIDNAEFILYISETKHLIDNTNSLL